MSHISKLEFADGLVIAGQAQTIRDKLLALSRQLDEIAMAPQSTGDPATIDRLRSIVRARRARDKFFPAELFADPAWDILLELYGSEIGGYRTSVSSLCIGAAVPATTALRWIRALEHRQLIVRTADPDDGRRIFMALSPQAAGAMDALLRAVPASEPLI